MLTELNHWNADDKNVWISGNVGFGHLMLYNTPESINEKLPYTDSLARLTITADARIDNRDELFALLGITTPGEKQIPDSLLILLAYKKYGADCVKYLVGDFAFAIWDEPNRNLFCARDQMGVKPFFYYFRDNFFAFASEKKGLLCLAGVDKAINKQFFYNQCFDQHLQAADTTLYRHIQRLKPACTLSLAIHQNKLLLSNYWTLDADTELKLARKEDYYEGLRHHFETAVKCRLRTNYPVGIELSGGMDSSSITGVASHFLKGTGIRISTFTNADNPDSLPHSILRGGSEVKYAEEVINFNGIEDPVMITNDISDDPLYVIDLLLKINDGLERWNLAWQFPIRLEAMKRNIRTIFSGFPGDEMATYRGDYSFLDLLDRKNYIQYFKTKTRYPFKKYKPFIGPGLEFMLHKINNLTRMNAMDVKRAAQLFPFPLKYRLNRGDEAWEDINYRERFSSYRHYQKYRLLKAQIPQRMETETHYSTWFRMEARFPMADIRLTQFYLSMPNNIKYEGDLTRSAWRNSIGRYLPDTTLQRDTKTGVMFPYAQAPQRAESVIAAFSRLVNGFAGYSQAEKEHILKFFSNYKGVKAYCILFSWYKKNFEDF